MAGVIIAVTGLLLIFPGRTWSREHVNYITATNDHPLECFSCHLYIQKDNLISKLVNADYYSPFNLAVSRDGNLLYVVAEEENVLLVVDRAKNKIIRNISVGKRPHSVALDEKEQFCYVSNQWSDYVSVIDLSLLKVTDTLKTGNGPAGMTLSADGRYLFVVNSFSNDISVFDLENRSEIKRLDAGNNPTGIQLAPDGQILYVTSRRGLIAPYGTELMTELTVLNGITQRISEHKNIESAYMMENIAFTPYIFGGIIFCLLGNLISLKKDKQINLVASVTSIK